LGPAHPETARSTYNLACVAANEGKHEEALAYLEAAIHHLSAHDPTPSNQGSYPHRAEP